MLAMSSNNGLFEKSLHSLRIIRVVKIVSVIRDGRIGSCFTFHSIPVSLALDFIHFSSP